MHLAATRPERVTRLALLNPKRGGSYAVEPVGDLAADTRARWGLGDLMRMVAEHLTDADRTWVGRHERRAASPAVAGAMAVAVAATDVTALLPHVKVPVLVLHTGDVRTISPEDTRAVADASRQ